MGVYVTGDTHGSVVRFLSGYHKIVDYLTKDDIVIVLGDFFSYSNDSKESKVIKKHLNILQKECKFTIAFIDGNHDNYPKIYTYPIIEMFNGTVHQLTDNVFHLMRGQIYTIQNHTFFVFGGAYSVDKPYRTIGYDWWPEEYPSEEEKQLALTNLEQYNYKVDFALTHTAPSSLVSYMYDHQMFDLVLGMTGLIQDDVSDFLDPIFNKLSFEHHYFGHFHKNRNIDNKHTMLFQSYEQIF
jgi:hypothetical protein